MTSTAEQDALAARLRRCYSGAVHDVLRGMGFDRCVLPPAIKAIAPGTAVRATPIACSRKASRSFAHFSHPPTSSNAGFPAATASR